ncbi:hypothetical protein NQ315_005062 [Exocentrus adspersus]|uniref:Peptidase aspartic putative domain-containing protein n=1 Tax=Exocentrus adspersus TaxID=1586481 RepID=A0AAV8VQH2_9CUCU|nr:hypothetical protein NQ315_005062 [Exocentrus adspersus]
MEQNKKYRRVLRGLFTKRANELDTLLQAEQQNASEIDVCLQLLQSKYEELLVMDNKIREELLAECGEEDLSAEITACDEYKQRLLQLRSKCTIVVDDKADSDIDSTSSSTSSRTRRKFKLPRIELKKFNDDIKDWLPFWAQFKKIHDDVYIERNDKFAYLSQAMVPVQNRLPENLIRVYQEFTGRFADSGGPSVDGEDSIEEGRVDTLDARLKQLTRFLRSEVANEQKFALAAERKISHQAGPSFSGHRVTELIHSSKHGAEIGFGVTKKKNGLCIPFLVGEILQVTDGPWLEELKAMNIALTDVVDSGPTEILFGADVIGKLYTGRKHELNCGLFAIETLFGWTLMGRIPLKYPRCDAVMTVFSLFAMEVKVTDLGEPSVLEITDPVENRPKQQKANETKEFFEETTRMEEAKMHTRGWEFSNCCSVIKTAPVLGLVWNVNRYICWQ